MQPLALFEQPSYILGDVETLIVIGIAIVAAIGVYLVAVGAFLVPTS